MQPNFYVIIYFVAQKWYNIQLSIEQTPCQKKQKSIRLEKIVWKKIHSKAKSVKVPHNMMKLNNQKNCILKIPPAAPWFPIQLIHIESQVRTWQSQSFKSKEFAKTSNVIILKTWWTNGQQDKVKPVLLPFKFGAVWGIITSWSGQWQQIWHNLRWRKTYS